MSQFRVETVHGRHLLCGGILPDHLVQNGQIWASADGSDRTVKVSGVRGEWVGYTWKEGRKVAYHEKLIFAFQCRYCLVLPTPNLPKAVR